MGERRTSNLAEKVLSRLSAEIRGGRLAPGARLPTEQVLTSTMGVSRTVVREAVDIECPPKGAIGRMLPFASATFQRSAFHGREPKSGRSATGPLPAIPGSRRVAAAIGP